MAVRFRHKRFSLMPAVLGMSLVILIGGCSGGGDLPPLHPATGTVLYNGEAVEGAAVVFRTKVDDKNYVATGTTDAQGKFELSTSGEPGAVAGTYTVTVSKKKSEGGESESLSMEEAAEQAEKGESNEPKVTNELPEKYGDPNQSDLKKEVTAEGPNDFKLELSD